MIIGIDVDDTITRTTKTLNKIPGMTKELFHQIISNPKSIPNLNERLNEIFGNIDVFTNAVEVINELKSNGNKIIIITARGSQGLDALVPITKEFIKKVGLNVDEVIFYQERKGNACKKAGVDIFIDDNEIVLDEVKEKGISTIRFSPKKVVSNHRVLHSWLEIKKYIERMGDKSGKNN